MAPERTRTPSDATDRLQAELSQARARLVEELKTTAELREDLRQMELRALQSQVSPHFLFNTLATIAAQSTLESAPRTTRLTLALSRLLRYNLRRIRDTVTLREELASVRDYLLIQEARLEGRLRVDVSVPQDLQETRVPVLSVQPLVENAILHGLETVDDGWLRLSARRVRGDVEIEVADNGQGIGPERLRQVLEQQDAGTGASHTTGLGLYSVHKRVQYFFGPEYGLSLDSRPGRGTRAVIRLPFAPSPGG
ncbi:MAG: sensor histidine kinase [Bacillota bacterium]|nr:sensor histidine kinase [Bacillota bacterium]